MDKIKKKNIYNAIQNLYNMDFTTWQEVLSTLYNLVADVEQKFDIFEKKFESALGLEVTMAIKELYNNGTLKDIINTELLTEINAKVNEINNKVIEFKDDLHEQLDNKANLIETNIKIEELFNTKVNITDLSNDKMFMGSKTTIEIKATSGTRGQYYYSIDEKCYYMYSTEWINVGTGNNVDKLTTSYNVEATNRYLTNTGKWVSYESENFKSIEIDVFQNERFLINCDYRDYQRVYSVLDTSGNILSVYPTETGAVSVTNFTGVLTVPKNGAKLRVCGFKNASLIKLPILDINGELLTNSKENTDKITDINNTLEALVNNEDYNLIDGYLTQAGTIITPSSSFEATEIEVQKGDVYLLSCACRDASRLYVIKNKEKNVLEVYPNINGYAPQTIIKNKMIKIEEDGYLLLGNYKSISDLIIKSVRKDKHSSVINELIEKTDILYKDLTAVTVLSKYIDTKGNIAIASENFELSTIKVKKGDSYIIDGAYVDWSRLYSLKDDTGKLVKVYPNTAEKMSYTVESSVLLNIPCDGTLYVSNYKTKGSILKIKTQSFALNNETEFLKAYNFLIQNVLCIGDSLTAGAYYSPEYNGRSIKENYPYYLGKINNWTVTNGGKSGISASGWWNEKRNDYQFELFDTVIIWLGTNNGYTDTIEEDTASGNYNTYAETETGYYCRIIEYIKEKRPDVNIFLCTVFASKSNVSTTNEVIRKIAEKYDLDVFEMNDGSLKDNTILHPFDNGIHFGKIGNVFVANKLSEYINKYINNNLSNFEKIYIK